MRITENVRRSLRRHANGLSPASGWSAVRAIRFWLLAFLAVLGPGFITANVDNDPGGILTYSQAGAKFGYGLLWTLVPTTIALIVVQEMAARMGAASAVGIFGVSKYIAVPLVALLVWAVVVRGTYTIVERVLIVLSLVYFAYPVSAYLSRPDWRLAVTHTFLPEANTSSEYLSMVIGLVGTTITPWMQFYLQASIVEKGITTRQYAWSRWDVIIGCIITDLVAFFIVVACGATLHARGIRNIADAADAAVALAPLAGRFASVLFAAGLLNAALLSAAILPLATAYNVAEGLGFESGINKRFSEAPAFYWLYTFLIVTGAAFVLVPRLR